MLKLGTSINRGAWSLLRCTDEFILNVLTFIMSWGVEFTVWNAILATSWSHFMWYGRQRKWQIQNYLKYSLQLSGIWRRDCWLQDPIIKWPLTSSIYAITHDQAYKLKKSKTSQNFILLVRVSLNNICKIFYYEVIFLLYIYCKFTGTMHGPL